MFQSTFETKNYQAVVFHSENLVTVFRILKTLHFSHNPLHPGVAFLYPLKTSKRSLGFLMFSGGIDKQHKPVMG